MVTQSMDKRADGEEEKGFLLSPNERVVCQQLASGDSPHKQHAQALLALDKGATQEAAGQQAGLTKGQVRYWLGKFRKTRIDIFPNAPAGPDPEPVPVAPEPTAVDEGAIVEMVEAAKDATEEVKVPAGEGEAAKEPAKKKKAAQKKSKKPKKPKKGKKDKAGKKTKKKKKAGKGKKKNKSKKKKKTHPVEGGKKRKKKAKKTNAVAKDKKKKANKKKSGKKQSGKKGK